jgi:hypothetical protein
MAAVILHNKQQKGHKKLPRLDRSGVVHPKPLDQERAIWETLLAPEPTRSYCHAWSASFNYDLLPVVAGIQPATPGFNSVLIAPHLRNLKHLEAAMPHEADEIHVIYDRKGDTLNASITLPPI